MKKRHFTPEQQRQIINLWSLKKKTAEISFAVKLPQITVNEVLNAYISKLKRIERQTAVRPDIEAVDYSNHDEIAQKYAGVEFEDTRPPHLRGLDWPFRLSPEQRDEETAYY
jgi:hypothetical protein